MGTECLITVHLRRLNVTITTNVDALRPTVLRPNATTAASEAIRQSGNQAHGRGPNATTEVSVTRAGP